MVHRSFFFNRANFIRCNVNHFIRNSQREIEYNEFAGDERLRRARLIPDGKPRGTELVKPVQMISANNTSYAALPLAA